MGAAHEASEPSGFRRAWLRWRRWRHTRPFWGGLLVTLGGIEILASERAPLPLVIHIGLQGLAGYLTPAILVICGLLLLFHPVQRVFYSLLAIVLSLGSWITSNLGGFFVGLLLGLIGGCLAFAWVRAGPPGAGQEAGHPAAPARAIGRSGSGPGRPAGPARDLRMPRAPEPARRIGARGRRALRHPSRPGWPARTSPGGQARTSPGRRV